MFDSNKFSMGQAFLIFLNLPTEDVTHILSFLIIQEPEKVLLGRHWKYVTSKGRKKLKRISDYGYYVPLLKSLEVQKMS